MPQATSGSSSSARCSGSLTVAAIIFAVHEVLRRPRRRHHHRPDGHHGHTVTRPTPSRSTPSTRPGCWSRPSWCSSCRPASCSSRPGFARARETVNVLLECIVDTCLCGLLFWAFGFAFMFGAGNGWIGHTCFFLNNPPTTYPARPASRSWRSCCSSTPSPTPARRSPPAPWSVAPASSATSSTASACRASSTRSSATGSGVRAAGWPRGPTRTAVPRLRRFDGRALGRWLRRPWPVPSSSVPVSDGSSSETAVACSHRPRPDHRRRRWCDPLVRLVRLQPRLDAVSAIDFGGIGRVAANTTLAASAAGLSAMFVMYPDGQEVGPRHQRQRLPGRSGGHHLSLLLGQSRSEPICIGAGGRRGGDRRCRAARVARASTIRSVPGPSTACAASGAR